mmetsp:Transcript_49640/g.56941  ORF Transcript_49640/g.56941 Transcript_49640/m.56941 type:complete len:85 (+) Transcript_49640:78-332(+)
MNERENGFRERGEKEEKEQLRERVTLNQLDEGEGIPPSSFLKFACVNLFTRIIRVGHPIQNEKGIGTLWSLHNFFIVINYSGSG